MITHIHHVSYVVEDLDTVMTFLREQLGMEPTWVGAEERGMREATYDVGQAEIQIKQPLRPDTELAKFLRERGPGIHHVAWATTGIDDVVAALSAAGNHLREGNVAHRSGESSHPRLATTYRVVNIMPDSGHGLGERIQLVEDDQ
jgi:methylmalonyl-CoA/ethylmalonyl-CoA epimerase